MGNNCFKERSESHVKKNKIIPLDLITNNECLGHPKSHIHIDECKETSTTSNERDKTIRPKVLRKKTPSKMVRTSTLYHFEN